MLLLHIATSALRRNRLRSALTVLGMAVGIAAVITMVALGSGARAAIEDQVEAAGANLVNVNAGNRTMNGVRLGMGASSRLTADDAAAVSRLQDVAYVSPSVRSRQQLIAAGSNWSTMVEGVGADLPRIRSWSVLAGTFFGPADVRDAEKVCVMGTLARDKLLGIGVNPVGRTIRIGIQPFTVIGLLAPKGLSAGGRDQDDVVFAPYTTVQKKLMGVTFLNAIAVSAASPEAVPVVASRVRALLRARHAIAAGAMDDFRVRTTAEIVQVRTRTARTMTVLLGAVGAVSLVVAGIGVMNIMLASVAERTREVGLRLAVGARQRDVLRQFLLEAVMLCALGGAFGLSLGYASAEGLTRIFEWETRVPSQTAAVAVAVSAAIGLFFGWYPARRAASTSPIEALRFE